jgi:hypothetical protein
MRYGACTPEDIKFLRTKIAGRRSDQPTVASKDFRNVAIICGINTQKDMINQLGCERFAAETSQSLTNFYSIDKWGKDRDPATKIKWGKSKAGSKTMHRSDDIDYVVQKEIWKLRHGASEHVAGKLSLCLGMPVMIRNNDATELCITKGQEGTVVGWQSYRAEHGKNVLDTLFVELINPPQLVQIPGLPDNVVPIVKSTNTITCTFPSNLKESIRRQQVSVLPNFAMTAHASQGKTRPYNVVHLNSCRSHMAYYTALSRSASAANTIIIQGFEPRVITQRCTGYLRQEFREQELLDDITRLKYEGQLPTKISGSLRNPLIHQYQKWKGTAYVPTRTDLALKWSSKDPFELLAKVVDSPWQILDKSKEKPKKGGTTKSTLIYVPAVGSISLPITKKHKLITQEKPPMKKPKLMNSNNIETPSSPLGLIWDGDDYSCAYDALFTIFYNIWVEKPRTCTRRFKSLDNQYLTTLVSGFDQVLHKQKSFEVIRDIVRSMLHAAYPERFPMG